MRKSISFSLPSPLGLKFVCYLFSLLSIIIEMELKLRLYR
jgi:hypothetical protein